jgi:predicted nucleotidyltransferase
VITAEIRETIIVHFEGLELWRPHWPETAVAIVGSAVRGRADEFSDIDIAVYVPEKSYWEVYERYREAVEAGRVEIWDPAAFQYREFPFVVVAAVRGHYRVDTFEEPEGLAAEHDDVTMWVQQASETLHDPSGRYGRLREACAEYPEEVWREKVRFHFLEAVWTASGAGNPLRRDDRPGVVLTMTESLKHLLRLCCLLDRRPFPYDKWLYREALETTAGRELRDAFEGFFEELSRPEIRRVKPERYERPGHRNMDLEEFPLYMFWRKARNHLEQRLPKRIE